MFRKCDSLKKINLFKFNSENVNDMSCLNNFFKFIFGYEFRATAGRDRRSPGRFYSGRRYRHKKEKEPLAPVGGRGGLPLPDHRGRGEAPAEPGRQRNERNAAVVPVHDRSGIL